MPKEWWIQLEGRDAPRTIIPYEGLSIVKQYLGPKGVMGLDGRPASEAVKTLDAALERMDADVAKLTGEPALNLGGLALILRVTCDNLKEFAGAIVEVLEIPTEHEHALEHYMARVPTFENFVN